MKNEDERITLLEEDDEEVYLNDDIRKIGGVKMTRRSFKTSKIRKSFILLDTRRDVIVKAMAGLTAEAAWRQALCSAAEAAEMSSDKFFLPSGTMETLDSGRAVIIPNFLSLEECEVLRKDIHQCFDANLFTNFVYAKSASNKNAARTANGGDLDIWQMPSFSKSTGADGPFVNPDVGNYEARQRLKARMAQVKAESCAGLYDRPSMVNLGDKTHEMEYLRYGAGASLQRHTDEHHIELLYPGGSARSKKPTASRRSITWLIYLNDLNWNADTDGGQLRLHERTNPAQNPVGARGKHLQIGWLKKQSSSVATAKDIPVFLDPNYDGATDPKGESCMLFIYDPQTGNRNNLASKPFPNAALYLAGGDALARKLMSFDKTDDAATFHLIDAPKSKFFSPSNSNEDGGERTRDITPQMGTLVMFDSVSMPHEVLNTSRERLGVQGWFHEKLV
eukprot:CAMPEP_0194141088 /NCGR_PEP_ID=MMETSP0152-20130528/10575_1 /TAXON_ID=1049557 /ORGANISM="Thalassiothrix antarctica, Strain L6-D1" /LENGTH=448 /DNA_ID=CAMNT_0038839611 /DNA_START=326 /DNA_END=1672 /DNA_ORIENTATION=+